MRCLAQAAPGGDPPDPRLALGQLARGHFARHAHAPPGPRRRRALRPRAPRRAGLPRRSARSQGPPRRARAPQTSRCRRAAHERPARPRTPPNTVHATTAQSLSLPADAKEALLVMHAAFVPTPHASPCAGGAGWKPPGTPPRPSPLRPARSSPRTRSSCTPSYAALAPPARPPTPGSAPEPPCQLALTLQNVLWSGATRPSTTRLPSRPAAALGQPVRAGLPRRVSFLALACRGPPSPPCTP